VEAGDLCDWSATVKRSRYFQRNLVRLALVVVLVVTAFGCDSRHGYRGEVGILADVSGSTEGMWHSYAKDMHKLISRLPERVLVYGDRISSNSAAFSDPCKQFLGQLKNDPTQYQDRDAAEKARAILSTWINHVFDFTNQANSKTARSTDQVRPGTDILTEINDMEFFFKRYPKTSPKNLFIFSDMVEQTPGELDLTHGTLSTVEIENTLNRLQKQGLIPDLEGVHIWLIGINADPSGFLSVRRLANIKTFWFRFFLRAKAIPEMTHWGARLLLAGSDYARN